MFQKTQHKQNVAFKYKSEGWKGKRNKETNIEEVNLSPCCLWIGLCEIRHARGQHPKVLTFKWLPLIWGRRGPSGAVSKRHLVNLSQTKRQKFQRIANVAVNFKLEGDVVGLPPYRWGLEKSALFHPDTAVGSHSHFYKFGKTLGWFACQWAESTRKGMSLFLSKLNKKMSVSSYLPRPCLSVCLSVCLFVCSSVWLSFPVCLSFLSVRLRGTLSSSRWKRGSRFLRSSLSLKCNWFLTTAHSLFVSACVCVYLRLPACLSFPLPLYSKLCASFFGDQWTR